MLNRIQAGAASQTDVVFIRDTSQTSAVKGLTGLTYSSSGLQWYYRRQGQSSDTPITLVTATLGTYASGGFVQLDATNMDGQYEISYPAAAVATGATYVTFTLKGAANMETISWTVYLDAVNYQDSVRFGMSSLPNVAIGGGTGSLPVLGTGAGQIEPDGSGNVNANLTAAATAAVWKMIWNRRGANLWIVDPVNGNDSNAGTFASPLLTPLPVCKGGTLAGSVASGDMVLVGPGTCSLSTNLAFIDGVSMTGCGMYVTTFTSSIAYNTGGAIVKPGSNAVYSNFGIVGTTTSLIFPFGFYDGIASNTIATGWTLDSVYISNFSDGIYCLTTVTSPTAMRGVVKNCRIVTQDDGIRMRASATGLSAAWDGIIDIYNTDLRVIGTSTGARGIVADDGTFRLYGSVVTVNSGSSSNIAVQANTGANTSYGGAAELYGTMVNASGAGAYDLQNTTSGAGTIVAGAGTQYSPDATNGTITVRTNEVGDVTRKILGGGSSTITGVGVQTASDAFYISCTVNDASATASKFAASGITAGNSGYINMAVVFTSGTLKGQTNEITGWDGGSPNRLTFFKTWSAAPANGDAFTAIGLVK